MLGLGDAVVVNDPLTAPGANSVALAADAYLTAIRAHGDAPYDRAFMEQTSRRLLELSDHAVRVRVEQHALPWYARSHVLRKALVAANEAPAIRGQFVKQVRKSADCIDWLVSCPIRPRASWSRLRLAS